MLSSSTPLVLVTKLCLKVSMFHIQALYLTYPLHQSATVLPAKVHLANHHLITTGMKATMARQLLRSPIALVQPQELPPPPKMS